MRVAFVIFLFGHAAVHGVMWTLPFTDAGEDMPFDPAKSWLVGDRPEVAAVLAGLVAVGFGVAGVAFAARVAWWPGVLGGSAAVSLVLMVLFWSPYWIVGLVLSTALGISALQAAMTT